LAKEEKNFGQGKKLIQIRALAINFERECFLGKNENKFDF
jgi:hypothetical protein